MNRPIYETPEDIANQTRIINDFCEWAYSAGSSDVKIQRTKPLYQVDFVLLDGQDIRCFVEVKQREYKLSSLPDVWLSYDKFLKLREYSRDAGALLVFQFTDHLAYYIISPDQRASLTYGGRSDRNDPQDMEPVVRLPSKDWKIIG